MEYNDTDNNIYENYVSKVRYDAKYWGGHVEIMALSIALQRPIHIYSIQHLYPKPLIIDATNMIVTSTGDNEQQKQQNNNHDTIEPIRLSYHYHYYALGEHYNEVVPTNATTK